MNILFENISTVSQEGWCFVGMPEPLKGSGFLTDGTNTWEWTRGFGGIWVHYNKMPALSSAVFTVKEQREDELPFIWFPGMREKAGSLLWEVFIDVPGVGMRQFKRIKDEFDYESPTRVSCGAVIHTLHRYRENLSRVTLDLDLFTFRDWPTLEFCARAVYGDARNDHQQQEPVIGQLLVRSGAMIFDDFCVAQERQPEPSWQPVARKFALTMRPQTSWHRAREYEMRGFMLTREDPGNRRARLPVRGLCSDWSKGRSWGPVGVVPKAPATADSDRSALLWRAQNPTPSMPRRSQPPNSGQTGEQETFGVFMGTGLTLASPFECHSRLYDVQACALRPTSNREPDGEYVKGEDHPGAQLWNRRPDERFSRPDMLGWPDPVGWITGYTTSDAQHRAYNDLHALYLLTRDPAIRRTLRNHVELDKMAYGTGFGGDGAPRAVGRCMLEKANLAYIGIEGAMEHLQLQCRSFINRAWERWASHGGPVKTFFTGTEVAKYGWFDLSLNPPQEVRGIAPWQDAILVKGCVAAQAVLNWSDLRDVIYEMSVYIVEHAFYRRNDGSWDACWALRWNGGQPIPAELYTGSINNWTYPGGWNYWLYPPVAVAARSGHPRALELLPLFGAPRNMHQSQWMAL